MNEEKVIEKRLLIFLFQSSTINLILNSTAIFEQLPFFEFFF